MTIWVKVMDDHSVGPMVMVCDSCGKRVPGISWESNGPEIECIYQSDGCVHRFDPRSFGRDLCADCYSIAVRAVAEALSEPKEGGPP